MPPKRPFVDRRQRGVSFIEIMVAVAIVAILAGTAVPSFQQGIARNRVTGRTAELVGDLAYARSEALSRNTRVVVSFLADAQGACYVLHTGANDDCVCATTKATQCKNGAVGIRTALFPAGDLITLQPPKGATSYVAFSPSRGTAKPGSITLSTTNHLALKATVAMNGRVQLCCSDTNAIPGYTPCKT